MKNYVLKITARCLFFIFCFGVFKVSAQTESKENKWHYLTEIYLIFPTMSGDIAVGELPPIEVDADAGSIFGNLKMGAMLYFEATNDDWSITSDLIYMKLGQDVVPGDIVESGDVTMKQTAWEVTGLKRITPWLDGGLGGRLVSLYTGLDLQTAGDENKSEDVSKTWVDPIVILRSQGTITGKLFYQLRGDVGGFGIGSDFAWQMQANLGYGISDLFQASIGYRYIGIDYDKDGFGYNVDTYGPVMRFGFNF